MKVPDGSHGTKQACLRSYMDIGRANPYEQAGRQAGLRIWVADAGVRSTEHLTFIHKDVCVSRHFL